MSLILPAIPILLAVLLLWFYGWRLVLAITLSVTLIPFIVLPGSEVYDRVVKGKEVSLPFSDVFVVAGLIAFFGWLFYMLLVAPLYIGLKTLGFSLAIYFPLAVALIVTLLCYFISAQPMPLWGWGLVALCGYVHAWLILWVMGSH